MNFVDRILKCSDCGSDFIFTAGEQLFFLERQFKNDPKRCKLCKARRAGLGKAEAGSSPAAIALPLSRTETRTACSACGLETTVPFKPTQGRPVFCRSCFQLKRLPGVSEPVTLPTASAIATMAAIAEAPAAALPGLEFPSAMNLQATQGSAASLALASDAMEMS